MINEPARHPTSKPPTKPGPIGKPRANAPDQESPTSTTTEHQHTLDEHLRRAVLERDYEVESELLQADNNDLWRALRSAMSVAENLTELLMIERDETARLRADLKEREDSLRTQQLEIRNRDEELAKHEFGLYAKELELKVECPNSTCVASFVGDKAAEELVAHVLKTHVDVEPVHAPRRWTSEDAYRTPEGADRPQFVQGFNRYKDYRDGKVHSNGVVFQYVVGGQSPRWRAMTETEGDGHQYSWAGLLSENSSDAYDYLEEVPDPREKQEKADA